MASCTVGGNSLAGYIREVHIRGALCAPGATGEILVAAGYPNTLQPGQSVSVSLDGTLVLTGSVTSVDRKRPSHDIIVGIADEYLRVSRYFITEQVITTAIASCSSLVGQALSGTGISYNITAPDANAPAGVQIGLRFAHEALQDILAYMSAYAYCDPDGTLQIRIIGSATKHTFSSGIIDFTHMRTDEITRNVIKVFGASGIGPVGGQIFAKAERAIGGISPDRTAVVGSGLIETQAEAQRVADYLINELGIIQDVAIGTVVGYPSARIGDLGQFISGDYSGTEVITTLQHDLSDDGFTTAITTGQRCPRISGWSRRTPPVYAGTSGSGVYRSVDGGITWTDFNTGLPTGTKYVTRIAANAFEQVMSIVNNAVYFHNGNQWHVVTLPDPVNTAGDSPAPTISGLVHLAVSPGGALDQFNVLSMKKLTSGSTVQDARTWVYSTENSGSTWSSTELDGGSSGSGFHVIGLDMTSRYGIPYVVASSGSIFGLPAGYWWRGNTRRVAYGSFGCRDARQPDPLIGVDVGVLSYDILDAVVTGTAPNRQLKVNFRVSGTWQFGGTAVTLYTGRMVAYTSQDTSIINDNSPIRLTSDTLAADADIIAVSSDSWSKGGFYVTTEPYTFEKSITFNENSVGNTFGARIVFHQNTNNPLLILYGYIRTGEPDCEAAMFTGSDKFTYAQAAYMWFSFGLL